MQAATQQETIELLDLSQPPSQPLTIPQQPSAVATTAANQPAFSKSESFLLALLDRGATPEQIGTIMDLADRQDAKLADQAMNEAMAGFKAEAITILKSKHVGFDSQKGRTDYDHAELATVLDAVTPRLSQFGLSVSWKPVEQTKDWIRVACTVKHVRGGSDSAILGAAPDASGSKNSIQAIGSACTYLSRYLTLMLLGLAAKNADNDGRGNTPEGVEPGTARAAAASDTYPAADFERNLPAWDRYIQSGKKTADDIVQTVKAKKPFSAEQEQQIRAIKRAQ